MQKFLVGGIARGTLPAIVDPADGITPVTPSALTCLVIKNGTDTADSVTITAVGGGLTGVYKWSYDPAGDAEFDEYSLVFTITIDSLPYYVTVDLIACVAERGTDGANTTTPPTAAANAIAVLTTVLTESYATDGVSPTLTQAILLVLQHMSESSVSGVTKTVKKLDGSTTAATFTLNSATTPTAITRSA